MQDFFARDPDEMHYQVLREQSHYLKDEVKGVGKMNEILQRLMDEKVKEASEAAAKAAAKVAAEAAAKEADARATKRTNEETAVRLLSMGLPPEQVAQGTGLPLEEVHHLDAARMPRA